MSRRGDLEAAVSLAMLPVGVALGVLSVLAFVGFAGLAFVVLIADGARPGLMLAWCAGGALIAVRNVVTAIEATGGLDWRPMTGALLLWALVVIACPLWWVAS